MFEEPETVAIWTDECYWVKPYVILFWSMLFSCLYISKHNCLYPSFNIEGIWLEEIQEGKNVYRRSYDNKHPVRKNMLQNKTASNIMHIENVDCLFATT